MNDREILFRGKRTDNGEWVFGLPTKMRPDAQEINAIAIGGYYKNDMGAMIQRIEEIDPETVGQYTGLLDKSGKKIFEGDVFRFESGYVGEIKFGIYVDDEEDAGGDGNIQHQGYFVDAGESGTYSLYSNRKSDWFQTIGNVFDNPELLEVAK